MVLRGDAWDGCRKGRAAHLVRLARIDRGVEHKLNRLVERRAAAPPPRLHVALGASDPLRRVRLDARQRARERQLQPRRPRVAGVHVRREDLRPAGVDERPRRGCGHRWRRGGRLAGCAAGGAAATPCGRGFAVSRLWGRG
eukprot:289058-Chlamydomonas_euryale.AAC.1